jgi:hypothetical protein
LKDRVSARTSYRLPCIRLDLPAGVWPGVRRLASAEEPASCPYHRWTSPCVAACLAPLAPVWAPRNLISIANEKHVNSVSAMPTAEYGMPDGRTESTLCGVTDLYIVDFGDGEEKRSRRDAEREEERCRLADRYTRYLVASAGVEEATARRTIVALFDHRVANGTQCSCSCHPRLSAEHGDGFDCRCTWDEDRRIAEAASLQEWLDSPEAAELSTAHQHEEDAIGAWLADQPGVDARRTSSYAPERWEGIVDSHTFYFRERGGSWRIELDLLPSGRYARRLIRVDDEGKFVTEPVPIMEGEVIARGTASDLGAAPVDHIAFVVRRIRDHLRSIGCEHHGARLFCPDCGRRTSIGN